jgi:hypothetical protein
MRAQRPEIIPEKEVDHPRIGVTVIYFHWCAPGEEPVPALRIRRRKRVMVEQVFSSSRARTAFVNRWLAAQYMDCRKLAKMHADNIRGLGKALMGVCWAVSLLGYRRKRKRTVKIEPWDI